MSKETPPFEDVFPIEHGDFRKCHVSFHGSGQIMATSYDLTPNGGLVRVPSPFFRET